MFKSKFMMMMEEFHQNGRLVRGLNPSFIVLILKKKDASEILDYKPMFLIGGIYKIVSKILSKRLCRVLNSIISKQQCAFILGR